MTKLFKNFNQTFTEKKTICGEFIYRIQYFFWKFAKWPQKVNFVVSPICIVGGLNVYLLALITVKKELNEYLALSWENIQKLLSRPHFWNVLPWSVFGRFLSPVVGYTLDFFCCDRCQDIRVWTTNNVYWGDNKISAFGVVWQIFRKK